WPTRATSTAAAVTPYHSRTTVEPRTAVRLGRRALALAGSTTRGAPCGTGDPTATVDGHDRRHGRRPAGWGQGDPTARPRPAGGGRAGRPGRLRSPDLRLRTGADGHGDDDRRRPHDQHVAHDDDHQQ